MSVPVSLTVSQITNKAGLVCETKPVAGYFLSKSVKYKIEKESSSQGVRRTGWVFKIMKTGREELYVFLFQPEALECLGYLYLVMIQNTLDMGIRNWLQMDINQTIRVDNTTQNNCQLPRE